MVLIWIIGLGLLNFLSYAVIYAYVGGDAPNGKIDNGKYYVKGHFLQHGTEGHASEVSQWTWIYSYIHSISIWPTIGLVLCAMMILARPHILATIQEDSVLRGHHFVTASMTVIVVVTGSSTLYFLINFFRAMSIIRHGENYGI